jgi:hypothetical protein
MSQDDIMWTCENCPAVGPGKGVTMHGTDGVEFATAHLVTDVTLYYADGYS